jgi:hypothetical protein
MLGEAALARLLARNVREPSGAGQEHELDVGQPERAKRGANHALPSQRHPPEKNAGALSRRQAPLTRGALSRSLFRARPAHAVGKPASGVAANAAITSGKSAVTAGPISGPIVFEAGPSTVAR